MKNLTNTSGGRLSAKKAMMVSAAALIVVVFAGGETLADGGEGEVIRFNARERTKRDAKDSEARVRETSVAWKASETAVIICDMWDQHWCKGATRRVGEMAGRMNRTVKHLRGQGAFIIHAPSGVVDFYSKTPQRRRAIEAVKATPPVKIEGWCYLDRSAEASLPIDDSDGGCNCEPQCKQGSPWSRQHAGIEIYPADAISDNGQEVFNLMAERGLKNVILMGVHTNMCVLGRPFGIRQMKRLGKNVALVRDLTDTMYNSQKRPFVSHERGTELVVEHIETYWCPSVTSGDLLNEGK